MSDLLPFSHPVQDPVLVFGLCMAVILLAPALFTRIRLPGMVGLILAGVLVGPNAMNLLERSETIVLLGTVGLLYIMFMAGLDINLNQFNRYRHRSLVFGILTFAIPQVVGTLVFLALGFSWPAAILIASMFASHTLVAYPIASRLGIAKNQAVTTAVGGTILTDTAALLVLVAVARHATGDLDGDIWLTLGVPFAIYVAGALLLLPRLGRWFFRKVQDGGPSEFAFLLAAVFLCSWLAKAIGTEAIIGAFLAGLAFNRLVPENGPLMGRINFFGEAFVIPFFLLYIGMLVDVSVLLGDRTAWVVMGAMVATLVATKWGAAMITGRIFRYTKDQSWVIFGLSACQAAATLAATLVGYELGIIGDAVLNGVVLMILVTCLLGPWVVQRWGREVALQQAEAPLDPSEQPQRVLVPVARPAAAEGLLDVAFLVRGPEEEPVFPLFVVPRGSPKLVADGEANLGHAVRYAAAADIPITPLTRVDPSVASGITRAVQENRIATIVVGWNGEPSTQGRIFGGVLDQLLEQTTQTVIVCKLNRPVNTFTRMVLVVPPHAEREPRFLDAVRILKRMAATMGFRLLVLVVDRHRAPVEKRFTAVQPAAPTDFHSLKAWASLDKALPLILSEKDLLILMSARTGRVSWEAGLRFLPAHLSRWFPDTSFLTVYPGEPPIVEEGYAPEGSERDGEEAPIGERPLAHRVPVEA